MAITTDFDLKPKLEDYRERYPGGDFETYQIVFEVRDEHEPGTYSYIIVFDYNSGARQHKTHFIDFLQSYCTYEKKRMNAHPANSVLPQLKR
ncbi:MAG: hypothetical protein IPK19_31425 [Chloroflexi bacterium]|nr:hypothetical protein [Chloroflexota bacterium]